MKQIKKLLPLAIACFGILVSTSSWATGEDVAHRCEEDSLDSAQAEQRVKWAIRCAKQNGGVFYGHDVNAYVNLMFETIYDDSFNVVGNKKRDRPKYPIFTTPDLKQTWVAPVSEGAACTVPRGYVIHIFCTSSCYRGDQKIAFVDEDIAIKTALDEAIDGVMVVDASSSMDNIRFREAQVQNYVRSLTEVEHKLYHINTVADQELVVTDNHPLVDGFGKMRRADDFKVGQNLVRANGEIVEITSIKTSQYFGKVYNLQPALSLDSHRGGVDTLGQIIVAEGYLSGSDWYQNGGEKNINRLVLRNKIPADLL